MSVKFVLLALLQKHQSSIYQLRGQFEAVTGQSWNLNIGQVSTTLQRLERDGLVQRQPGKKEADPFTITPVGEAALAQWWCTPVDRSRPQRSEMVMKIIAAVHCGQMPPTKILQIQRRHLLETMRDYTRLKRQNRGDLTWHLILENHIFMAEAELRWLDEVEVILSHPVAGMPVQDRSVSSKSLDHATGRREQIETVDSEIAPTSAAPSGKRVLP